LTLLKSHPHSKSSHSLYWFNTREEPVIYISGEPFVLRDADKPKQNRSYTGITTSRLEKMEERLRDDILEEAHKCGGLLMIHEELDNGDVVPSWICPHDVFPPNEVFHNLKTKGYPVNYERLPIAPEQRPEDKYLDQYVDFVKNTSVHDILVFNCGMGVGRTTFAMAAAIIVRRNQMINSGMEDPFPKTKNIDFDQMAILRLVYVLERGLASKMSPHSAIEWALARSSIIDNLKNAILGNFQIINNMTSVLEEGGKDKFVLDRIIDQCDNLINIREEILMLRVRHSITGDLRQLEKALGFLERYLLLLLFCSYTGEIGKPPLSFSVSFSSWIKSRPEIVN
jgi:hypothetical protein